MNIEKRDVVKCLILSIITCGIYGIIWVIKMMREAVSVKNSNDDGLIEIILALVLPFLGFYLAERKLSEGCAAKGIDHKDNSPIYLVLGLLGLGIVNYCLLQSDLNKIADITTGFGYNNPTAQEVPYTYVNNNVNTDTNDQNQ